VTPTTGDGRHHLPADGAAPAAAPDDERPLARSLGRPLLLVFWTLVVWGTVYAVLFAFAVVTEGPSEAFVRVTTGPDRIFGIVSLTLAVVALLVWGAVGLTVVRVRSGGAAADDPREDSR
jgi:hypothetical protein